MILAKSYQKFLLKYKILINQAQRTVFLFIACSKFAPKSIHQIARFQLRKYQIFQLLRRAHHSSDTPCSSKCAIDADGPLNHPPMSKMDLRP